MDALIGTFHIDWKSMVAQIINFTVVFFVLYRFALKPLMKMMDERNKTIKQGIDDAAKHAHLLEEAKDMHEKELAIARQEAHQLISEVKKSAEEKRIEMMDQTETDVKKMIEDGKKSIEDEKNKIVDSLKKEVGQLVILATEKVIGTSVKEKLSQEVVLGSLDSLTKK